MRVLFLAFGLLVLAAGCKKDDSSNSNITVDQNGNVTVNNDADGALYSAKVISYDDNSSSSNDESHFGYAWFGKPNAMVAGGAVNVNGVDLDLLSGINYYIYFGFDQPFTTNASNWTVEGNSANGITGFSHTDNSNFPQGGNFTLPSSININSNFTLNFTSTAGSYATVFSIEGNKGSKTKAIQGGSGTVSFSSEELKEVAFSSDIIAFGITPVNITNGTVINGKKYYFVKQISYLRQTETL